MTGRSVHVTFSSHGAVTSDMLHGGGRLGHGSVALDVTQVGREQTPKIHKISRAIM